MGNIQKRRIAIAMLLLVTLVFVAACGNGEPAVGPEEDEGPKAAKGSIKARISVCNSMDHPQTLGLLLFKKIVEEESDGVIEAAIHPNSESRRGTGIP